MKKLIPILVLGIAVALFHAKLENLLLNSGVSWLFSKATPYIIVAVLLIIGVVISYTERKKAVLITIIGIALSIGIGVLDFALSPIYEGDFSHDFDEINLEMPSNKDEINNGLMMISIPGCPYCHAATNILKQIKDRSPELAIHVAVLSSDTKEQTPYANESENKFTVHSIDSLKQFQNISNNSYPSFAIIKDGVITKTWSNGQFGMSARDFVEKSF